MRTKFYLLLAALVAGSFSLQAQDQAAEPKQKVKIHVKITENGETKEITREVESDSEVNVDSILRELGVMEGMELTSRGQQIEVDIKKKSAVEGEAKDVSVNVRTPRRMHFHGTPGAEAPAAPVESRAFMGVYIENLGQEKAQEIGLKNANGAYITSVIEGTGAEKAGLQDGEVITKVNDQPVNNYEELVGIVRSHKAGEVVQVEVYSDGNFRTVPVELGEKKVEKHIRTFVAPDAEWNYDGENLDSEEFEHHMEELERKMEEMGGNFNWNWDGDSEEFNEEEFKKQMEELSQQMKEQGHNFNWNWNENDGDFDFDFDFDFDEDHMAGMNKAFLGIVPGDDAGSGVKIGEVVKGSAAEEMGLKEGDVIYELNGNSIGGFDELVDVLKSQKPGDEVTIEVERDGKQISHKGTLKSRAENHHNKVVRMHKSPYKVEKEVMVIIEIADISEEEAEELSNSTASGIDIKPESDLAIRSLQFAPNPNDGDFNLTFDLPNQGNTEIRVYDGNGRQVFYEMLGDFSGKYSNRINISDEPNGIYFLLITQGEQQFSKKIIKQ